MTAVMAFWAVALLIGMLGLPFTFALLRRFPDSGAGLALPLGLVMVGYGYFVLRVVKVLPAGRAGYLMAVVLLALAAVATAVRDRRFTATARRAIPALI